MAFGGKMDHRVRLVALEDGADRNRIADVMLFECVFRIARDRRQRVEIARLGQLVENHDVVAEIQDEMPADGRPDEPGSSRDQNAHDGLLNFECE
jgi:hypothetical protein